MTIVMAVASVYITKVCREKKELAASIQLMFDVYIFEMSWDEKWFGKQMNLNAVIAEKSETVLENAKKRNALSNWYTSVVDEMDIKQGIFASQKENYHWDAGLRKRYKWLAISMICSLILLIFIIGIMKNETIQEWLMRLIFVLSMVRWLTLLLSGLNDDFDRLQELDQEFTIVRKCGKDDLYRIERSITNHRKLAVKIPNYIYNLFKNNDEDRERRIAIMDADQQ